MIRTLGIVLAAMVVVLGVIVMSVKGRFKGEDIDYTTEVDAARVSLFKIISHTLTAQNAHPRPDGLYCGLAEPGENLGLKVIGWTVRPELSARESVPAGEPSSRAKRGGS